MPASSGNAQSSSSIAVPSADFNAGVISSRLSRTGVSGPSMAPEAMRNSRAYPIWPAAPVTVTVTGALLICDLLLENECHRAADPTAADVLGRAGPAGWSTATASDAGL